MTALNIKYTLTRYPDLSPGIPQYGMTALAADPLLQYPSSIISAFYTITTPAMPSANVYATLADAENDFFTNQLPQIITIINGYFNTSYTTIGTTSLFDQTLQDALAALTVTHTSSTVTRTVGGTATQCTISTKDNLIFCSLTESQTFTLAGGQSGSISLQTSPTLGGTYTTFSQISNANTGTLAVVVGAGTIGGSVLVGHVPAGYYYKLVPAGTGTNAVVTTKELTL